MKDLNELLQAILAMDAAQRKSEADAQAQADNEMESLQAQKDKIVAKFAKQAEEETDKAAKKQQTATKKTISALKKETEAVQKKLEETAQADMAQWTEQLVKRVLAR